MYTNIRPEIARIAEETVANLKGLEATIANLTNDVAWLCQSIGHPEAARLALTPVRSPFVGAPSFPGTFAPQIGASPLGYATPFGPSPFSAPATLPTAPVAYPGYAPSFYAPNPAWTTYGIPATYAQPNPWFASPFFGAPPPTNGTHVPVNGPAARIYG